MPPLTGLDAAGRGAFAASVAGPARPTGPGRVLERDGPGIEAEVDSAGDLSTYRRTVWRKVRARQLHLLFSSE